LWTGYFAAGISYKCKTPLIYFDKKLNGDDYRKIISNEIKPSLDKEYGWSNQTGKPLYKFCQDGDSTRTAKERRIYQEVHQKSTKREIKSHKEIKFDGQIFMLN
jgi:hypothetical protein